MSSWFNIDLSQYTQLFTTLFGGGLLVQAAHWLVMWRHGRQARLVGEEQNVETTRQHVVESLDALVRALQSEVSRMRDELESERALREATQETMERLREEVAALREAIMACGGDRCEVKTNLRSAEFQRVHGQ